MITGVRISKSALKDLKRTPQYIQEKFRACLVSVHKAGVEKTRKSLGWHDEPLQGERKGPRSIRLNKQWRAIYLIKEEGNIEFIEIIKASKIKLYCGT